VAWASTGRFRVSRRTLLRALALAPAAAAALIPSQAFGTDYGSAAEVFTVIDQLEAEILARLQALGQSVAPARPLVDSLARDLARHQRERARLRARLRLGPPSSSRIETPDRLGLEPLRAAQEKLVYAHAEGLPVIGDAPSVDTLARHLVDLSRHLAILGLWLESEAGLG
jgi:hypothetical protein